MLRINLLFVVTAAVIVLSVYSVGLLADDVVSDETKPTNDIIVTVTVRDLEKRPVANISCRAHITGPGIGQNPWGQTDTNGEWTFEMRVGDLLHVEAFDDKGNCSPPTLVEITDDKPSLYVNLTLKPAPKVVIAVNNARTGKPVVRLPLSILHKYTTLDDLRISTQSRSVETNDDGIATFYLQSGDYIISPISRDFTVKKGDTEVLIEERILRPSHRILRVQVNDSDGKPVENVDIRINPPENGFHTDRNGQCSARIENCNVLIRATEIENDKDKKTILRTATKFVGRDTETVTLTFQPNVTVKGKMIDIDTNRPASNVTINLHLCSGFDAAGNLREYVRDGDRSVQTKDDGSYEFEDLPVGAFYTFVIHEKDSKNPYHPNINNINLFVPNKDVTLPDVKVQCTLPEQNYNGDWFFRMPETEEQFIQRFSAAIESASLRERKTLLYFEERYKFDERIVGQYQVRKPYVFSLNPFMNNILVRDVASRYELVGGEVEFLNPSEDVIFITKQLNIDLTKEENGLLCILDEQGNLVAKRKFSELTREDDAGMIDVEKLRKFLEDGK